MLVQWTSKMCPFHNVKFFWGYRYTLSILIQNGIKKTHIVDQYLGGARACCAPSKSATDIYFDAQLIANVFARISLCVIKGENCEIGELSFGPLPISLG